MSTAIMALVWPLQIPPTQKSVLISLADNANDCGECWPSISTIGVRTCFGKTAVIEAIRWLEEHHFLSADRSNGRHTRYTILIRNDLFASPKPVRLAHRSASRTGSGEPPHPSASRTAPVRQADTNRQEPSRTVNSGRTGARLPDDWKPDEQLKAEAALRFGDRAFDLEQIACEFRDFWHAEPDPRGRKLDWNAVFRNRLRELARRTSYSPTPTRNAPPPASPRAIFRTPAPLSPESRLREHLAWLASELLAGRIDQHRHDAEAAEWRSKLGGTNGEDAAAA